MRSSRKLPSLPALRAFEAVGRLQSFRKAGEELLITQSAVSHHIGALEQDLGVKLFIRKARSISFTEEGAVYHRSVSKGLGVIEQGTMELRHKLEGARVRISLLPSFAANWLVPRLSRFADQHPEISLDLSPSRSLVDLSAGDVDLAIRFGDGKWPGTESRLLMQEKLAPVASPGFLEENKFETTAAGILGQKLLLSAPAYEWDFWAHEHGLDLSKSVKLQLSDYNVVVQAAADGQGIAMGRLLLIGEWIASGKLQTLTRDSLSTPKIGHWLVTAKNSRMSKAAERVSEWIQAETHSCFRESA